MRRERTLLIVGVLMVCTYGWANGAFAGSSDSLRIQNEFLTVEFDTQTMTFSVTARDSGLTFVERGTLASRDGRVRRLTVQHPTWGQGDAIQIDHASGAIDRLTLSRNLPFVVLDGMLAESSDTVVTSLHRLSMVLDLGKKTEEV
ncbi:MAG: hypothetical protein GX448_19295, partial [Planctomycetes bacterium]|nr:hypothetical protein [Planctomycetota bacterium]